MSLIINCVVQVEYDLGSSSKDNLVLLSVDRIEQSAIPMVMTWYPPLVKESFIITANDKVMENHTFILQLLVSWLIVYGAQVIRFRFQHVHLASVSCSGVLWIVTASL